MCRNIYLAVLMVVMQIYFFRSIEGRRDMGCFAENYFEDVLAKQEDTQYFGSSLTLSKCLDFCRSKRYKYTGVYNLYHCLCSNERPSFKYYVDPSKCSWKCPDDNKRQCGGSDGISVYGLEDDLTNYVQNYYRGCYSDSHALTGKKGSIVNLIPELCNGYCFKEGYKYSALHNGQECFCGDEIKSLSVQEDQCNSTCMGNTNLICGGTQASSIYATSITDKVGTYLGCFIDSPKRLLPGYLGNLINTNSPQKCSNLCQQLGYKYAGLESFNECYCGNNVPDLERMTIGKECQTQCPNNGPNACGARWRLALYSTLSQFQSPYIINDNNYLYPLINTVYYK